MFGLKNVLDQLNQIEKIDGRIAKIAKAQEALNNVQWFKEVVIYAYSEKKYHTTSLNYGFRHVCNFPTHILFRFLDILVQQGSCTQQNNERLSRISSIDLQTVEVVNRILCKDLKCGIGKTTWQKLIPELKPTYLKPMLAEKDIKKFIQYAESWDNVCWSIKFDGVRCITHINSLHDIKFYSRTGKEFLNFDHLKNELRQKMNTKELKFPLILDGEMIHKKGFQTLMKCVQKKDCPSLEHDIIYQVFDIPSFKTSVFKTRHQEIQNLLWYNTWHAVRRVYQVPLYKSEFTVDNIQQITKNMIEDGHEGIILRTFNGFYEHKRSRQLCKVKALYLEDKKIEVDLQVITKLAGSGKYLQTLGSLQCMYKGKPVSVGSGFTDAQRDEFWKEQPKVIEVHADSITEDGSLRFPIFSKVKAY